MVVLALVPCWLIFIRFAFEKLIDWISLGGLDGESSSDVCPDTAPSDEVHGVDSHDSFRPSAPTAAFRFDLGPSASTPDDDDGWWMDSPNGRNGRYVRARNTKKVRVPCDPGS